MKTRLKVLLVTLTAILLGCVPAITIKNTTLPDKQEKKIINEPYWLIGIEETEAIKKGETTEVRVTVSRRLLGEYYPGRLSWNFWGVSEESDKEYFGQMLFSGITDCSGYLRGTVVIDGLPKEVEKIKGVVFSTGVEYIYDLAANEIPTDAKFLHDREYRRKIILEKGTALKGLRRVTDFYETLNRWNRYQTPKGVVISPLGEEEIKLIAEINPQYSFTEKLIGSGRFAISPDYITTAVGIGIDVFRSANGSVPSTGWDYASQLPSRRNMAFIIEYVSEMMRQKPCDENIYKLSHK